MTNLSRRSLLTGLLSSAAVIAAGPVAKVVPRCEVFGAWTGEDLAFLEGISQQMATTLWYSGDAFVDGDAALLPVRFTGFTPFYNSSIDHALSLVPDGFNVLDGGAALPRSAIFDGADEVVGTFPRKSNAGMVFTRLA